MLGRIERRRRPFALLLAAALSHLPFAAAAAPSSCAPVEHEGRSYIVCEVAAGEDLRIWHSSAEGSLYGSFGRIDRALRAEGKRLGFAMNAGMYHPDRSPVGLFVDDGREEAPLVTAAGPGNFGMLPNGIFCIRADGFAVVESRAFAARPLPCRYATQSGPMLVVAGRLHPRFIPGSDSRFIRNGVGVRPGGGTAVFAISETPVNFDEFARLFRDRLGTPDALYLDGKISRLHAPGLRRSDAGWPMGPVVGTVVPE